MGLNFHEFPHLDLHKVEDHKVLILKKGHSFDEKGSTYKKNRMCHEWNNNL